MDKLPPRSPWRPLRRGVFAALALAGILTHAGISAPAAQAEESRSSARIDIIVGGGGILDPAQGGTYSILLRADETGNLGEGSVTVSLTEDPFTSEDQIRRFIRGESSPTATEIATSTSPEVPQLESRELPFDLNPSVLDGLLPVGETQPLGEGEEADIARSPAGIFGIETTYSDSANSSAALRKLTGRQILVLRPQGVNLGTADIAPIVTLTAAATGGVALRPEELEALTIDGGALAQVSAAVEQYPATVAIDSRITTSISVLGELAPPESLEWASTLGSLGLAQFGLPWADADPLASLAIDTLVYARLGEFPWVHGEAISNDQLAQLATRSASAVLLSSDSLPSDRAVVSVGDARIIRVDAQLSELARNALQAPTVLEAEADLQRAQGIIAYRALTNNPEILTFSTGRLPATAIAPRLASVLSGFSDMDVATTVAVPLQESPTEELPGVTTIPQSRSWQDFVGSIKALWESDVAFATIAQDPESAVFGRWTRYQALLSSTWSEDPNRLASEWARAQDDSRDFHNSVRIEQGSAITVLADQTALPITVLNDLDSIVVVELLVRPTTGILAVENPRITLSIPAQGSARALVAVQSLANGTVPVELRLESMGGEPISEMVVIPVTIRAGWEGLITISLAIVVGGTFTFGLVRAIQRRRRESEDVA